MVVNLASFEVGIVAFNLIKLAARGAIEEMLIKVLDTPFLKYNYFLYSLCVWQF
jgi:hypothetical protein